MEQNERFPERLLHLAWGQLHFSLQDLTTVAGEPIELIHPGRLNHDQGPDYHLAHFRWSHLEWWGQVEIHLHTQDWYRHKHHLDPVYNSTVLHVVYISDGTPVCRQDGTVIPELALEGRIHAGLIQGYDRLVLSQQPIPCAEMIGRVSSRILHNWLDRLAIERIQQKALGLKEELAAEIQDWEQIIWKTIAGSMGGPVNKSAFQLLADQVPFSLVKKYAHKRLELEALLMGAAGLLSTEAKPEHSDPQHPEHGFYVRRTVWVFLRHKHALDTIALSPIYTHRMRPQAFPTLRLAQLTALVERFPVLTDLLTPEGYKQMLDMQFSASEYWDIHYIFFEESKKQRKSLGRAQKELLMINALLPLSLLYGQAHGRESAAEEVETALLSMQAENNRISRLFTQLELPNQHALHSQAWIQLYKQYCLPRNCLSCHIGQYILFGEKKIC